MTTPHRGLRTNAEWTIVSAQRERIFDLERRLRAVEAQRDALREALEHIAGWPIHGSTSSTAQTLIGLARAVLHDTKKP